MNVALHCMNVKHNNHDNTLTNFAWICDKNKKFKSALLVVFCGDRFRVLCTVLEPLYVVSVTIDRL